MKHSLGSRLGTTAGIAVLALAGTALVGASPAQAEPRPLVPKVTRAPAKAKVVKDSYIVGLKTQKSLAPSDVRSRATDLGARYHGTVGRRFEHALHGFTSTMNAADADRLRRDPAVAYVVPNSVGTLAADDPAAHRTDNWGLDRLDDHAVPGNFSYVPRNGGAGVHAYVLDTGVSFAHTDFGGRATSGPDFVDNDADSSDCHGHGTHVAGTIAGTKYGVAKEAQIVGVRVVNCDGNGTAAQLIAGLDWVTANAVKPAVVNLSLRFEANEAVDAAVETLIASGVTVAVAAGNDNDTACRISPARVPGALTVGATDRKDRRASFSNTGHCVDLFAPGDDILSAWLDKDWTMDHGPFVPNSMWNYESGTSMASPHVAGASAMVLADHPDYTPEQVHDALLADALTDKITDEGSGSPNKLLYIGSTPRDFQVTGSCGSSPMLGSDGSGAVTFERKSPISQWVQLSATDLPPGVTVQFDDNGLVRPFWQSPVGFTVKVGAGVDPGYHSWTLVATGTEDTHTRSCYLNVQAPYFTLAASPSALTVAAGQSVTTTISSKAIDGPSHSVTFQPGWQLPAGTTVTFQPSIISSAGGSTTATITPPATLAPGTYSFDLIGNSPWATGYARAPISLTVTARTDGCQATNTTPLTFPVAYSPGSPVTISGCGRKALANASVEVHITHKERGYISLRLVGPDGTSYPLKQSFDGNWGVDLNAVYPLDLSAKNADGVWKLMAGADAYTGTVDRWTLTV